MAVYWVAYVERSEDGPKVGLGEIWRRFPKFVLGFVGASLLFSLVFSLRTDAPEFIKVVLRRLTELPETLDREARRGIDGGAMFSTELEIADELLGAEVRRPWRCEEPGSEPFVRQSLASAKTNAAQTTPDR